MLRFSLGESVMVTDSTAFSMIEKVYVFVRFVYLCEVKVISVLSTMSRKVIVEFESMLI